MHLGACRPQICVEGRGELGITVVKEKLGFEAHRLGMLDEGSGLVADPSFVRMGCRRGNEYTAGAAGRTTAIFAPPAEKRARMNSGHEFVDGLAQLRAELHQPPAFLRRDGNAIRPLAACQGVRLAGELDARNS